MRITEAPLNDPIFIVINLNKIMSFTINKIYLNLPKAYIYWNLISFTIFFWILRPFVRSQKFTILFASDSSGILSGNLENIHSELKSRNISSLKMHFSLKPAIKHPRGLRETYKLAKYALSCSVILLDDYFPEFSFVKLKINTYLLQLWHASGAYKRVGYARQGLPGGPNFFSRSHRKYNGAIVSSASIRECYSEAFGIPVEHVFPTGVPRTDKFFDSSWVSKTRIKIRNNLGVEEGQKVVLVATTFHGNGQLTAQSVWSEYNWSSISNFLDDYLIVVKDHPFNTAQVVNQEDLQRVRLLPSHENVDEMIVASDIIISDFSSLIFDAALLDKPVIHLTKNLEDYSCNRGFFFDPQSYIWGKTARTNEEIIEAIQCPTTNDDSKARIISRHIAASDGSSTKRVVDQLVLPNL